jgi:translocation and assembly module TamA
MRRTLIALAVLAACTPARHEVEGDIVRDVRFEGNGGPMSGHNDYQLAGQMGQEATSFGLMVWPLMYFVDPAAFSPEELDLDPYRLEVWYAHNGWFDAQFEGWTIQRVRNAGKKRAGIVDIRGYVNPGQPTLVRSFQIEGLDRSRESLGKTVKRTGDLQEESQFVLDYAYSSRNQLLSKLRDHAHAYAEVEMTVDAFPDEHAADVKFEVEAGITTVMGPLSVTGNDKVKEAIIRSAMPFDEGDAYKQKSLREAQSKLFDLGTFSLVEVEPDLSDPTRRDVPINVRVHESKPRTFRMGVGGDYFFNANADVRVSAAFEHVNLFRQLIRLNLDTSVGLALTQVEEDLDQVGEAVATAQPDLLETLDRLFEPTWRNSMALEYPRIANGKVSLLLSGSDTRQLQSGQFPFRRLDLDPGMAWRVTDDVVLSAGPHWERFEYLSDIGEQAEILFGDGFQNPYRLMTVQTGITIDWRDDPASAHRGSYWNFSVAQGVPGAGSYNFLALSGDARAYRPIKLKRARDFPFTIAGRIHGRIVQPWGESEIPYPELAFLGGSNSLRGFLRDQAGSYRTLCTSTKSVYVPAGGRLMAGVNTELRYDWAYGVTFATFVDTGILAEDWEDLATNGARRIRGAAGVGARYNTLVGPVRLDIAARPVFREDYGPTSLSTSCDASEEAIPSRFTDLLSLGNDYRTGDLAGRVPLAINVYITIGEAI